MFAVSPRVGNVQVVSHSLSDVYGWANDPVNSQSWWDFMAQLESEAPIASRTLLEMLAAVHAAWFYSRFHVHASLKITWIPRQWQGCCWLWCHWNSTWSGYPYQALRRTSYLLTQRFWLQAMFVELLHASSRFRARKRNAPSRLSASFICHSKGGSKETWPKAWQCDLLRNIAWCQLLDSRLSWPQDAALWDKRAQV